MTHPKPRLLIFPFDLLAHYLRTLQLADQLKDQYEIHFCTSLNYGNFVRRAGYAQFPCKSFDSQRVLKDARRFRFSWLNTNDVLAVVENQIQVIRALRPAAVIGDAMPGLRIAAQAEGVPYLAVLNGYMTSFYQHRRSLPPDHPLQRVVDLLPVKIGRFFSTSGEQFVFKQIQRRFNRIRNRLDLPLLNSYLEELEGDWNLVCDHPDMFPQQSLPPHFYLTGPLFHHQTGSEDALLTRLDPQKKTLLVSAGSSGDLNHFTFLNDARFRNFNIIVTGGPAGQQWSPHVFTTPFANLDVLLKRTDLALLHGGNGSIYQALAAKVPVLAAPTIFEQEWNVAGLERLGLGARLPNNAHPDSALRLVNTWLDKSSAVHFPAVSLAQTLARFKQLWLDEIEPHIVFSKML